MSGGRRTLQHEVPGLTMAVHGKDLNRMGTSTQEKQTGINRGLVADPQAVIEESPAENTVVEAKPEVKNGNPVSILGTPCSVSHQCHQYS